MKTIVLYLIIIGCFLSLTPLTSSASVIIPASANKIIPPGDIYQKIANLKLKEFQKLAGRKLSLKEKIGFLVLKHKIKHPPKAETGKGHTAMIFGIVALGLFVAGLFIPYVILGSLVAAILAIVSGSVAYKQNKDDKKAFTGKLLGWITLGLIALLFILAAIVISSWGF